MLNQYLKLFKLQAKYGFAYCDKSYFPQILSMILLLEALQVIITGYYVMVIYNNEN